MLTPSISRYLVALAMLSAVLGCGSKELTSSVSGQVTLDDQPLTKGTITFAPQGQGRIAYGEIDGSGRYSVRTLSDQGMVPGTYLVTIIATGEAPASDVPPPLLTPAKYSDSKTSGLTADVKPGANTLDFKLDSK